MNNHKFECSPENAPKFLDWIKNRHGIAHWQSRDLSNLGQSWTTPVNDAIGNPVTKPTWQCGNLPDAICTSANEVSVITDKEVKRFRVATKRGCGFSFVLSDASNRKLNFELAKLNNELSSYHFDYETQEAILTLPDKVMTLSEWEVVNAVPLPGWQGE